MGALPGESGAVAEWSKALAWKVSIRQNRIEGSNPSRSAISELFSPDTWLTYRTGEMVYNLDPLSQQPEVVAAVAAPIGSLPLPGRVGELAKHLRRDVLLSRAFRHGRSGG